MFDSNMSELDKLKLNLKAVSAQFNASKESIHELTDNLLVARTNLKLYEQSLREVSEMKMAQDKIILDLNKENAELKKQLSPEPSEPVDAA